MMIGMTMNPNRTYTIYCITNTLNNKRYIGQTMFDPGRRWTKHKWLANRGGSTRFYAAIRKHGAEHFRLSSLEFGIIDGDAANAAEKRWIAELMTMNPEFGYNSTDGGDQQHNCGWKQSPEVVQQLRQQKIGKQLTKRRLRTQEEDRPIVEAFLSGMARSQICETLGVTPAKVQKALARWKERVDPTLAVGEEHHYASSGAALQKRALERNQPLIDAFLGGSTRLEIAMAFGVPYSHVKQVIGRYLKRQSKES